MAFLNYLDPTITLEERLEQLTESQRGKKFSEAIAFLKPLKIKHLPSWEHSARVALVDRKIVEFIHFDDKVGLYSGLLHDVGKLQARQELLECTGEWTEKMAIEMGKHVMDGYRIIRDTFPYSAEVIFWHHKFQNKPYPKKKPPLLRKYVTSSKVLIPFYGRILALADVYDAMHRINSANNGPPPTGEQIKQKMLAVNNDLRILVENLYAANILTTKIYSVA